MQITKVPENLLPFAVRCRNLTVSNTRTVLLTPEIYVDQNVYEQLVDLMLEALRGARKCGQVVLLAQCHEAAPYSEACGEKALAPRAAGREGSILVTVCLRVLRFGFRRIASNSLTSIRRL